MQPSAEIRWFHDEPLPSELRTWFGRQPSIVEENTRTDTYIVFQGSMAVGVKLRGCRFEIKAQREPPRDLDCTNGVVGRADAWVKFSLASPIVTDLQAAIATVGAPLVQVNKRRLLQRYLLDDGAPKPARTDRRLDEGCLFELTALEVSERTFWTLGLEAFGAVERLDANLAAVAAHIFAEGCPRSLCRDKSFSYPEWLLRLFPAGALTEPAGFSLSGP